MTITKNCTKRAQLRPGSTLIAIFWIMSILGMAVFASIAVVKVQSDIATSESHGRRAKELAEKGVAIAGHASIKRNDPLLQSGDDNEGYSATYESMATTLGINGLIRKMVMDNRGNSTPTDQSQELSQEQPNGIPVSLTNSILGNILINEWGMLESDANLFLSCLAEWVDQDDKITTLEGWESRNYEYDGITGRPFNRFFKNLDEIEFVNGYYALAELKPNWRDYFNVWTDYRLDIGSADAEMISLTSTTASGRLIDISEAQMIVNTIIGEDGLRDTEDDLQNIDPGQLLQEHCASDVSEIWDRYIYEGTKPQFSTIESKGWSGKVNLTIKMSLQNRGSTSQLLEREEILDYTQDE